MREDRLIAARPRTPRTVDEAREAVERSRERIAATLDSLEDRIVETRETIRRKTDFVRPARDAIRKLPLVALGSAFAIGLLLGSIGGDDDDEEDEYGFEKDERRALEEWRKRRRKLLMAEAEEANEVFEEHEPPGVLGYFLRSIGHEVAGVAVGIIAAEVAERLYGARSGPDDEDDGDFSEG